MNKLKIFTSILLTLLVVLPVLAQAKEKQILMVVTSVSRIDKDRTTGLWLEEFAVPYLKFKQAGYNVVAASPRGGQAPVDPRSLKDEPRVSAWQSAMKPLGNTVMLKDLKVSDFEGVFISGGHGAMFDLASDPDLKRLLNGFSREDKVIAAVCHGPAGLVGAKRGDGTPVVAGKTITAFTNEEERAIGLDREMPFLLESRLREEGALFVAARNWSSHAQVDGRLVTGQNPASSGVTADAVIRLLK